MKKKKKMALEEVSLQEEASKTGEDESEASPREKMEEDIALFRSLFPDVKGEEIPLQVWERVEAGESLAAAYSLFAVMNQRREEKIREVNAENEKKAPPKLHTESGETEYFSPEAVKGMSRKEIKAHYDAILASMEHWN